MSIRRAARTARLGALAAVCAALLAAGCVERDTPAGTTTPPVRPRRRRASSRSTWSTTSPTCRPWRSTRGRSGSTTPRPRSKGSSRRTAGRSTRHRLSRGNGYTMTPWAGRYAIAFAPVGQPVSKAVARATFEVTPGAHLVVAAAGLADSGEARVDRAGRSCRHGSPRQGARPGVEPPPEHRTAEGGGSAGRAAVTSCRQPSAGWVTARDRSPLRRGVTACLPGAGHLPRAGHRRRQAGRRRLPRGALSPGRARAVRHLIGESFVTGVARSDGIRPTIDQAQLLVRYPSDC